MSEEINDVNQTYLETPSIIQDTTTLDEQILNEYRHKIFPKIGGLCQIFTYLKRPPLTFGSHISLRVPSINNFASLSSYFMFVLPQRQSYLSIKPSDFLIYNSEKCGQFSKSLLTHKLIYDSNPDINFIIHSHDKHVDAISSLKCGLLKMSTESIMLKNVIYHDRSFYTPTIDGNGLEIVAGELSSKIRDSRVLFLRCNGALCYGSTVEETFYYLLKLEAASMIQILAKCGANTQDESNFVCDPDYCEFLENQNLDQEFFCSEYVNFLSASRNYINLSSRRSSSLYDKYDKYNDNSLLNTSSVEDFPLPNYRSETLVCNNEHRPKRPNSSHESKVNIPKCESIRENVLSYEFRSNITSTASHYEKSTDDQEELSVLRRAKRFKAKRCCSLTSGVEKAIAKKVFGSTTPCDERQMQ